jgi:CHAD domain-containing protein
MKNHPVNLMKEFVRGQTAKRLKKLESEVRNAASGPDDPDAIHDLRVSIRRLNQELRVFQAWFKRGRVKKLRRSLKGLMEQCGAVRNCDIAMEVLKAAAWQDPALSQGLEDERRQTYKKLHKTLQKWHHKNRARKWRENLQVREKIQESDGDCEDFARAEERAWDLLPAMIDDLFRTGHDAAKAGTSHQRMHRFRLMTKHVRYTLEVFTPVYETETGTIMEALKGLQERLGAINDCAASLVMVHENRAASAAIRGLAEEREMEFRKYWRRHFGARVRTQWKDLLGRPQPESQRRKTRTRTGKVN